MSSELPEVSLKNLKTMIWSGNYVEFTRYFDGNLWYGLHLDDNDYHNGGHLLMEFPVPVSDIGTATFPARDKAILFMRYIRKHLTMLEEARKTTAEG